MLNDNMSNINDLAAARSLGDILFAIFRGEGAGGGEGVFIDLTLNFPNNPTSSTINLEKIAQNVKKYFMQNDNQPKSYKMTICTK